MKVATVVKWPGGKAQHVGRLLALVPEDFNPARVVDAMCGSAAFGLAAKQRWPKAELVLNDTSRALVVTLLDIRDRPEALAEELALTPYARALHANLSAANRSGFDLDALDWLVLNRQSVGGALTHTGTGWSRDQRGKKLGQWRVLPERILAMARVLCGAYVESQDFEALLVGTQAQAFGWDAPDALVYLDPPYPGCEGYYGMGPEEAEGLHRRIAAVAQQCRGRVMVSYADTPEFRERVAPLWGPEWRRTDFDAAQHMQIRGNGAQKGRRTEIVLANFEPVEFAQGTLEL